MSDKILSCLFFTICSIISIGIIITLPIVEIIFGIKYLNKISCHSEINIPLDIWLLIKGCYTFIIICCIGIYSLSGEKSIVKIFSLPFVYLLQLFHLIWVILGSIIFWNNCINSVTSELSILLYISLISGYMSFFSNSLLYNKTANNKKTNTVFVKQNGTLNI